MLLTLKLYSLSSLIIISFTGVKGGDCIVFFDWEDGEFIRKIDVSPEIIFWNEAGDAVVLACAESYYVLRLVIFVTLSRIYALYFMYT